jgi:hypothetical protein
MVINLDSLSFSSIYTSLSNYFANQAQSEKWKDFYQSSAGRLFIRLLSAFGSFISYECTINRREAYLSYAQNRTSLIGISQILGYSTGRGTNEVIQLFVTPNFTGSIPAYSNVGSVKGYDLITIEDTALNKGVSSPINVYIGNLNSESISVDTEGLKVFRFISLDVSDYIRLKLNGSLVPTSLNPKDLWNDKYLVISNPLGAVDVAYLQEGSYPYKASDILTLEFIKLAQVDYKLTDLIFDYGTISSTARVLPYVPVESKDSIRVNAPLYHEVQVLIRARNDYLKEFKALGYNFSSTNSRDFAPAIVDLSYARNDYTVMIPIEEQNVLSQMYDMRAMGVPMPRITNPVHFKLELDFDIKRSANNPITLVDVQSDVDNIISAYEKTLKPSIDRETLERSVDNFSYVKRTRVNIHTQTRANNTKYRLGDFITTPTSVDMIYMARDFIKKSALSEPVWSYTSGDIILDNGIAWRCTPRYGRNPQVWYPDRYYKTGDLVKSTSGVSPSLEYMFEFAYIQKQSGATIPTFTTVLQDFTEDNDIIWVCKPKVTQDIAWQANNIYNIGDSILNGDFSYQVIGFKGSSSGSVPPFKSDLSYPIITANTAGNTFTIQGNKTSYFLPKDTVRVQSSSGNDGYYSVINSTSYGSTTIVSVNEPVDSATADGFLYSEDGYTKDGEILWEYFNSDEILFNYNWNNYIKITSNIELS